MVKGEYHVQLFPLLPRHQLAHLHAQPRRLPHGKSAVGLKGFLPDLPQILMQPGAVVIMLNAGKSHQVPDGLIPLRQPLLLGNVIDHIHAEPIHAPVKPAVDHGNDIFPHFRVVPV